MFAKTYKDVVVEVVVELYILLSESYKSVEYQSKSFRYYFRIYIGLTITRVSELRFNYSCFS